MIVPAQAARWRKYLKALGYNEHDGIWPIRHPTMANTYTINYIPHINGRYITKAKWLQQRRLISEHYANDKATEDHMLQLLRGVQPQASASITAENIDSTVSVHMDMEDTTPIQIAISSSIVAVTSQQEVSQIQKEEELQ